MQGFSSEDFDARLRIDSNSEKNANINPGEKCNDFPPIVSFADSF